MNCHCNDLSLVTVYSLDNSHSSSRVDFTGGSAEVSARGETEGVSRCITANHEDVGHGSYEQYTVAVCIADDLSHGLVSLILLKGVRDQSQAVTIMQPFNCICVDVHLMCIDIKCQSTHANTHFLL